LKAQVKSLVCKGKVVARLPPSLGYPPKAFRDTPRGYFSGQFYTTYTTDSASAASSRNFQLLSVFDAVKTVTSDITSYQVNNCDHIYTVYITDQDRTADDDFTFSEPGTNVTLSRDILAYGFDTDCYRYLVQYDPVAPSIVIASSVSNGPSDGTFKAIKQALENLGNAKITAMVKQFMPLANDGSRSGLADFICDHNCLLNKNLPNGTCPDTM
jgi:hypothetical protein